MPGEGRWRRKMAGCGAGLCCCCCPRCCGERESRTPEELVRPLPLPRGAPRLSLWRRSPRCPGPPKHRCWPQLPLGLAAQPLLPAPQAVLRLLPASGLVLPGSAPLLLGERGAGAAPSCPERGNAACASLLSCAPVT